jgi:hypothetical protein
MIFKFKNPFDKGLALPESYIDKEKVKIKEVMLPWICPDCHLRYSVNLDLMREFRETHKVMCGKERHR